MNTIDHKNYPKRLKEKSSEALRFIIKDCQEVIAANPQAEKVVSGYYQDEICYCANELHTRRRRRNE